MRKNIPQSIVKAAQRYVATNPELSMDVLRKKFTPVPRYYGAEPDAPFSEFDFSGKDKYGYKSSSGFKFRTLHASLFSGYYIWEGDKPEENGKKLMVPLAVGKESNSLESDVIACIEFEIHNNSNINVHLRRVRLYCQSTLTPIRMKSEQRMFIETVAEIVYDNICNDVAAMEKKKVDDKQAAFDKLINDGKANVKSQMNIVKNEKGTSVIKAMDTRELALMEEEGYPDWMPLITSIFNKVTIKPPEFKNKNNIELIGRPFIVNRMSYKDKYNPGIDVSMNLDVSFILKLTNKADIAMINMLKSMFDMPFDPEWRDEESGGYEVNTILKIYKKVLEYTGVKHSEVVRDYESALSTSKKLFMAINKAKDNQKAGDELIRNLYFSYGHYTSMEIDGYISDIMGNTFMGYKYPDMTDKYPDLADLPRIVVFTGKDADSDLITMEDIAKHSDVPRGIKFIVSMLAHKPDTIMFFWNLCKVIENPKSKSKKSKIKVISQLALAEHMEKEVASGLITEYCQELIEANKWIFNPVKKVKQ